MLDSTTSQPGSAVRTPTGELLRPDVPGAAPSAPKAPPRTTNRVVQVVHFGGPEGLEVVDTPLPTAGPGEVRIRVLASSLEFTDVVIRRHLYAQTMFRRPPFVLGYDVV